MGAVNSGFRREKHALEAYINSYKMSHNDHSFLMAGTPTKCHENRTELLRDQSQQHHHTDDAVGPSRTVDSWVLSL